MPGNWDPEVYRGRAKQWREAAPGLPDGRIRKAYLALAEGYEKLADLIEKERAASEPSSVPHAAAPSSARTPTPPGAAQAYPP